MDRLNANIKEAESKSALASDLLVGVYHEAALLYEKNSNNPQTAYDIAELYRKIHDGSAPSDDLSRFAVFCSELSSAYSKSGGVLFPHDESDMLYSLQSIAYLQNSFSDRAYRVFSERFSRVTAQYFPGFREACEEVYYGRSSHAILPIYSSTDGHLISFRKLIEKYDLKICCAADIEMNNENVMRFALLTKGIDRSILSQSKHSSRIFMDFLVILPYEIKYGEFLASCEKFGAELITANSHPLEYSGNMRGIALQFDITDASLDGMYLFLEGLQITYDVLGLYTII